LKKKDKLSSLKNSLKQYKLIKKVTSVILAVTINISLTPSSKRLRFNKPWNPNSVPIKIIFLKPE